MHPDLRPPPFPAALAHVWEAFCDLSSARGGTGMGPNPIAWGEIDAWGRLTRRRLLPDEIRLIMELDGLWLSIVMGS